MFRASAVDFSSSSGCVTRAFNTWRSFFAGIAVTCDQCTNLQELACRCDEALKKMDMEVIRKLDQQVMDQQQFLEKASVPGFTVTNNPSDINLQMYLLDFISRLNPNK